MALPTEKNEENYRTVTGVDITGVLHHGQPLLTSSPSIYIYIYIS